MSKTFVNKNCELYLGQSPYKEDMNYLPLDCFITEEEYEALPEEKQQEYCLLVDGKAVCPF